MSRFHTAADLAQAADLSAGPGFARVDRSFELPTGLYVATAACYFAFLLVMSLATMEPQLAIPMAICVVFIGMFFGVAAKWVRMNPANSSKALGWGQFRNRGITTHTGPVTARDATVQVLILPVLILAWGITIAMIRATL